MFDNQPSEKKEKYLEMLKIISSLSNLFSISDIPYLDYRVAENAFCLALDATNLSRSDCSIDAKYKDIGIGVKTFIKNNGKTMQKIAEFNKDAVLFEGKSPKEIIKILAHLRNERLLTTKSIYGVKHLIYHFITRESGRLEINECPMDLVNLKRISGIKTNGNIINFRDDLNEYSFNRSKSTLYKRFYTDNVMKAIDVNILENPYDYIMQLNNQVFDIKEKTKTHPYIVLPLYSDKGSRNVPEKSGLNQWNALGRTRNRNEVYIPIPSLINKKFPEFFPKRDTPFILHLPDGNEISSKVCQDNNKALMSNPNKALGEWMLRQVLGLKNGELLTYDRLLTIGFDSVVIYKNKDLDYTIDVAEIGSYDEFNNVII